ncbi:MAG: hypothetical protein AAB883_00190, partial [Patescibacteria group bacterium]
SMDHDENEKEVLAREQEIHALETETKKAAEATDRSEEITTIRKRLKGLEKEAAEPRAGVLERVEPQILALEDQIRALEKGEKYVPATPEEVAPVIDEALEKINRAQRKTSIPTDGEDRTHREAVEALAQSVRSMEVDIPTTGYDEGTTFPGMLEDTSAVVAPADTQSEPEPVVAPIPQGYSKPEWRDKWEKRSGYQPENDQIVMVNPVLTNIAMEGRKFKKPRRKMPAAETVVHAPASQRAETLAQPATTPPHSVEAPHPTDAELRELVRAYDESTDPKVKNEIKRHLETAMQARETILPEGPSEFEMGNFPETTQAEVTSVFTKPILAAPKKKNGFNLGKFKFKKGEGPYVAGGIMGGLAAIFGGLWFVSNHNAEKKGDARPITNRPPASSTPAPGLRVEEKTPEVAPSVTPKAEHKATAPLTPSSPPPRVVLPPPRRQSSAESEAPASTSESQRSPQVSQGIDGKLYIFGGNQKNPGEAEANAKEYVREHPEAEVYMFTAVPKPDLDHPAAGLNDFTYQSVAVRMNAKGVPEIYSVDTNVLPEQIPTQEQLRTVVEVREAPTASSTRFEVEPNEFHLYAAPDPDEPGGKALMVYGKPVGKDLIREVERQARAHPGRNIYFSTGALMSYRDEANNEKSGPYVEWGTYEDGEFRTKAPIANGGPEMKYVGIAIDPSVFSEKIG